MTHAAAESRRAALGMGASFSLELLQPDTRAAFDKLPDELLMHVVHILLRDEPQAVCRLVSSLRALQQLVRGETVGWGVHAPEGGGHRFFR